jgi:hypothetical protein
VARIVLDMSPLVACDRGALLALARLRGRLDERPECVLDVVGARWSQFEAVLADEPVQNLDAIRAVIRELRRPIMLDPCTPRVREVTEGLVAASVPQARGSVAQHRPESGADVAVTRGHDH